MNLFGILKPKNINTTLMEEHTHTIGRVHSGIKTLENLSIDLKNISKVDFVELGEEFSSKGGRFKRYAKSLVRTELEMFNEIELIEFESGETNVFFKAPVSNVKIGNLSKLVESFHHEFGEDMFGNTSFDNYDENSIKRSFWTGRYWNKNAPRISIKLMNDCLELSVLGLRK
ncbi:MAG: hypothetical protein H0X62_08770 [Bacteroidetes bacterium]|nr:hypothetical protein [Bacteroidota bacterium]